ncbi:MAG: acetyltransferase [Firmicutes bacterium]|nr:acetyltransferase [Bacillota bacterium]
MAGHKLLLVGGGGHCRSVLDCVLRSGQYSAVGIVERAGTPKNDVLGVPVVGTDEDLPQLYAQGWDCAAVTLGSVGAPTHRRRLYELLKKLGFVLPVIADPSAVVSPFAKIAEGTFIAKEAVINAGAAIGACTIINTAAVVEHDCQVGAFCHISPGAALCGGVCVEEDSHVGAASVVIQGIHIGRNAIVGAGTAVIRDVPEQCTVVGVPGRILERK